MRWTLNGTQSNMALPFTVQMAKTRFWFRSSVENAENVQVPNQTWSVMRSTFDQILFNAALERGAEWIKATAVAPIKQDDRVIGLSVRTPGGTTENLFSEVLIDAWDLPLSWPIIE